MDSKAYIWNNCLMWNLCNSKPFTSSWCSHKNISKILKIHNCSSKKMICFQNTYVDTVTSQVYEWLRSMGKKHAKKTLAVGHMTYLLMWLTDSCLQIIALKRQGTSGKKLWPKMEAIAIDAYFLKMCWAFWFVQIYRFFFLTHFNSIICAVFALSLPNM